MHVQTPPIFKMKKEKFYTKGMIAKRFSVNLKQVNIWYKRLRRLGLVVGGRMTGVAPIPNDPYGRWGLPDDLVKKLPLIVDQHKVIIIGEIHGVKENVAVTEKIFREMNKAAKVRVGFEWPQGLVDDPSSPDQSLLDDGRYSPTHQILLETLKNEGIEVFGFDIEKEDWKGISERDVSWRDERMSNKINAVLNKLGGNEKLLLVCGDAHFQTKPSLIKVNGEIKEFVPMASKLHVPSILAIHLKYLSGQFWNFGLKDIMTYGIDKERCFRPEDQVMEYGVGMTTPVRLE